MEARQPDAPNGVCSNLEPQPAQVMRRALDRQGAWLTVSRSLAYTRRDWVLVAVVIAMGLGIALVSARVEARWVIAVPLLAFAVFACILYRPLERWQWACAALYVILVCIYWAGLLPLLPLVVLFVVLSLLLPFAAAVYAGYRGA